jgi:hypothetical protein
MAGVTIVPGRRLDRSSHLCAGCGGRITIGDPKAVELWPLTNLNKVQRKLLLVGAAEYRDLCDEEGEYESAIQFVDWLIGCLDQRSAP